MCVVHMHCIVHTVVHFTWEMCALAVLLKLHVVQLGYRYMYKSP